MSTHYNPSIAQTPTGKSDESRSLINVNDDGTPPTERIGNTTVARRVYEDLKQNSFQWAAARARIQGVYDGNAPYDQAMLTRLGRSWACNVNFREMEALIDLNVSAAWSLHMEIGPIIDCKIDRILLPQDGTGNQWTQIIAEEYTRTLMEFEEFFYIVDEATRDCFKIGVGAAIWKDRWDFRPSPIQIGNLLVPPRAKCDLSKLNLFLVRDELNLVDLFNHIENRKDSVEAGWNIEALKKILVRRFSERRVGSTPSDGDTESTSTWESFQSRVRGYDPGTAALNYDGLRVVNFLVKEFTPEGGITHYIMAEDPTDKDLGFLFKKKNAFQNMDEILWLLPHNYGDAGKIRSIKGLGHRALAHCEFSNRFLAHLFDSGVLASSLIASVTNPTDIDSLQVTRLGPITVIPSAMQPIQTSFMPKMEGLVGLRSMSKEILSNNTGLFRPQMETTNPGGQQAYATAEQIRQQAQTTARFERSQAMFAYLQWQKFHQEVFRRLTNPEYLFNPIDLPGQREAFGFFLHCVQRGVPPAMLLTPGNVQVFSAKALGMGNINERQAVTSQLVMMKGSMDETARKWVDRQWALCRVGAWEVDNVFPAANPDEIPSNDTSVAVLENNSMLDGRAALVGSNQSHMIHIRQHIAPLGQYAQAFMQFGMKGITNLKDAGQLFTLGLPHIQEHMQALAQDPTRQQELQQMAPMIQQLSMVGQAITKLNDQQMQEQAQAMADQANQAPMSGETLVALEKIKADTQLSAMKIQSLNDMREQKTQEQQKINEARAQFAIQNQARQTAAQIEIDKAVAQADIGIKVAKAGAVQPPQQGV